MQCQPPRSKPAIASEEIDRLQATDLRFGTVLADAGYGLSAPFRQALSERGLRWAVGIPRHHKVYPADVALMFPAAGRGRPRQRHIPDRKSTAAEAILAEATWRPVSWRRGTKGRLSARFAAVRVRIAYGAPQRIRDMGAQHTPGEEAWLVGERRSGGERKYYLSNLPAGISLRALAAAIKARWVCEQAHQKLKEELGLDHFDGRSSVEIGTRSYGHRRRRSRRAALAIVPQRAATPSSPAPSAPRFAAPGLDRAASPRRWQ